MNFLRMDGPVMNFLRMVTNYIILQLIFVICCIPVITIGAAISAKYHVAMKLIKDEETGIVGPFFKAFAKNFKEATPVWLGQLVILFLIYLDWGWMIDQGLSNVAIPYLVAIIVITCVAIFITMVIFPMISRFEMTKGKLYKGAITFTFMNFFKLLLILLLNVASVFACIWYIQWLPVIVVVTSLAVTYFMASMFNKEFDKVENKYREEHPEEFVANETDEGERFVFRGEREETYKNETSTEMSYAASRKELGEIAKEASEEDSVEEAVTETSDDKKRNKLTKHYDEERRKLKDMTGKQKLEYFVDYYLAITLVIVLLLGGVIWYVHDVVKDSLNVMTGGLVNCTMTEDGKEYATEEFLDWAGYSKMRTAKIGDTTIQFESYEEYNQRMMDMALYAEINAGMFNYFFMDKTAMELYQQDELFLDISEFADISNIPNDCFVYNDANKPIAIILNESQKEKLGFPKQADIYLGFLISTDVVVNSQFVDYIFQQ